MMRRLHVKLILALTAVLVLILISRNVINVAWPAKTNRILLNFTNETSSLHPILFSYLLTPVNISVTSTLLVYVLTAPENYALRDRIRHTYANGTFYRKLDLIKPEVLFVLGRPNDGDEGIMRNVTLENEKEGDLLMGDFKDTYLNLTRKGLYAMNWINANLPALQYAIKADDEVFVNTFGWIRLVQTWSNKSEAECNYRKPCIAGYRYQNPTVMRDGKWATPPSWYAGDKYPDYIAGPAYLLTIVALRRILEFYDKVPFIPWEDIFFTGIVSSKAGIEQFDIGNRGDPFNGRSSAKQIQSVYSKKLYIHHLDKGLYEETWRTVVENESLASQPSLRRWLMNLIFLFYS